MTNFLELCRRRHRPKRRRVSPSLPMGRNGQRSELGVALSSKLPSQDLPLLIGGALVYYSHINFTCHWMASKSGFGNCRNMCGFTPRLRLQPNLQNCVASATRP